MVKLNLNNGTNNLDMEGKAVIAIVIDPAGHDADCGALMLGESSPHAAALAAGTGIGSIINQLGRTTFDRVMLAGKAIDQIKKPSRVTESKKRTCSKRRRSSKERWRNTWMKAENRDVFMTKELIEYLQGFPEDTEVHINVIDCHQDTKYGFVIDRLALITDEEYPVIFLDIDSQKAVDITARKDDPDEEQEDKDEELGS